MPWRALSFTTVDALHMSKGEKGECVEGVLASQQLNGRGKSGAREGLGGGRCDGGFGWIDEQVTRQNAGVVGRVPTSKH